ncbi:unnamed protein product [Caenorhabditis sp. 36 PRJEB53466]|nr:unnamed protein product [Caenorhabditis sp. 36 PRJEB53466]
MDEKQKDGMIEPKKGYDNVHDLSGLENKVEKEKEKTKDEKGEKTKSKKSQEPEKKSAEKVTVKEQPKKSTVGGLDFQFTSVLTNYSVYRTGYSAQTATAEEEGMLHHSVILYQFCVSTLWSEEHEVGERDSLRPKVAAYIETSLSNFILINFVGRWHLRNRVYRVEGAVSNPKSEAGAG